MDGDGGADQAYSFKSPVNKKYSDWCCKGSGTKLFLRVSKTSSHQSQKEEDLWRQSTETMLYSQSAPSLCLLATRQTTNIPKDRGHLIQVLLGLPYPLWLPCCLSCPSLPVNNSVLKKIKTPVLLWKPHMNQTLVLHCLICQVVPKWRQLLHCTNTMSIFHCLFYLLLAETMALKNMSHQGCRKLGERG